MRRLCIALVWCGLLVGAARAQGQTLLSLETAATAVQTGQFYEVNIRLDGASEVWLADMEITYDPALVYVMGAKSGSPVRQGSLFNSNASAVIRNTVQENQVIYTVSMLAPADPVSGSGVVGVFRIYPLAPGATEIRFNRAELAKAIFEQRDGQRVGVGSEPLPFTPVLLGLTITGEQVEPPSEATATPLPTDTPLPPPTQVLPTDVPTLVNVTAAPRTPEPLATLPVPTDTGSASSPLLPVAIAVMVVGGVGLLAVLVMWRRSRRR